MTISSLRSSLLLVLVSALTLVHNSAMAHSALTSSLPGEGQVVPAPSSLMLQFSAPVHLLKLSVVGNNAAVDIDVETGGEPSEQHNIPLPSLTDGSYTIDWTILGADGHTVNKHFGFTVDATASPSSMSHTSASDQHSHAE